MNTIDRDAEITAAIAAYENAATLNERIAAFVALEAVKNFETRNGRVAVGTAIHLEMVRIGKDTRVVDAMDAKSPFSKANWAKAKAARSIPSTQTEAA